MGVQAIDQNIFPNTEGKIVWSIACTSIKRCEFESSSLRGVLDTTLCEQFFSDLLQVVGFLRVLQVPSPIKLTTTI
jgi:hypothetical protein